jgi:hypothetical protein
MGKTMVANAAAVVFVVLGAFIYGRYCWKTLTHRIAPRLATWLIFIVASWLSLASYLFHVHADAKTLFVANIGNRADAVALTVILVSVWFSARDDPKRRRLRKFDWGCLAAAGLIVILWIATRSNLWAFILLQALMCVGYGPTLWHMLKEKRNTEPFDVWWVNLGLAALSLIPPILIKDSFGIVYAVRAILSVATILSVMGWAHRQNLRRSFNPR